MVGWWSSAIDDSHQARAAQGCVLGGRASGGSFIAELIVAEVSGRTPDDFGEGQRSAGARCSDENHQVSAYSTRCRTTEVKLPTLRPHRHEVGPDGMNDARWGRGPVSAGANRTCCPTTACSGPRPRIISRLTGHRWRCAAPAADAGRWTDEKD